MKNKVLIKLILPELDVDYDVFVPVNEIIWKTKILLINALEDILKISLSQKEFYIINKESCKIYDNNEIIINTDIRNGTELILLSIQK